jgi:Tn3 transposase DDE domain
MVARLTPRARWTIQRKGRYQSLRARRTGLEFAVALHEQMNSCSCLTLLLACVVYWQAKEISRVLKMGIPEGEDINISLLEHVSPIEWENVILYGQYVLNPDDIR